MRRTKQIVVVFITLLALGACSMLNKTTVKETVNIPNEKLEQLINSSVSELIGQYWLSDFLTEKNQRPILMTSMISTPNHIVVNKQAGYDHFDLTLLKTGQVRVVKSNAEQRAQSPSILASGQSVDFVITTTIDEMISETPIYTFTLYLWDNKNTSPVSTITKEFEINITQ